MGRSETRPERTPIWFDVAGGLGRPYGPVRGGDGTALAAEPEKRIAARAASVANGPVRLGIAPVFLILCGGRTPRRRVLVRISPGGPNGPNGPLREKARRA